MKKYLLLLIMFVTSSMAFCENSYNPNRPEWKDFCPFGLENIEGYNTQKSIIGTDKHWQIKEYNYWVDRKKDFNKDLKQCDAITDNTENQNSCYHKIIDRQNRINQTTTTPWQVLQDKKSQWQQAARVIQQQLDIQRQQQMIQQSQNMPKWSDVSPKQYNVNLNHSIKYNNY